jgi:long-chain acyl-CoA synthetase
VNILLLKKLENAYGKIDLIKQIFVYGDSLQSSLVSVIVPDEEQLAEFADKELDEEGLKEVIASDEFKNAIDAKINEIKKEQKFNGLEVPRKYHFTTEEFTVENDLLTPTMKLKRADAKAKYLEEIRQMYDGAKLQGEE